MVNKEYPVQFADADRVEIDFFSLNGAVVECMVTFFFFNDNYQRCYDFDVKSALDLSSALASLHGWLVDVERFIDFDSEEEIRESVTEYWEYGA